MMIVKCKTRMKTSEFKSTTFFTEPTYGLEAAQSCKGLIRPLKTKEARESTSGEREPVQPINQLRALVYEGPTRVYTQNSTGHRLEKVMGLVG